ncbi:MAG: formate dehydrogenase subunit gamma [Rhodospirillaceae bacterium]|nr:MAG: formate dehydrogenase subunit gamma [Rhodospirillaceae bacterium]
MHQQTSWNKNRAVEIIRVHLGKPGATLPMLHAVQEAFGCIPEAALPMIADALNITRAEVHGIVTFYHDFRAEPPGRHVLKVCRAEACQSMGGEALAEHVLSKLGVDWGKTTKNGTVTVEPIYCLGLCACAPSVQWDGQPIGRATPAKLDRLIDEAVS